VVIADHKIQPLVRHINLSFSLRQSLTSHSTMASCYRPAAIQSVAMLKISVHQMPQEGEFWMNLGTCNCGAAAPARLPSANDVRRAARPGDSRNRNCIRPITPLRPSRSCRTKQHEKADHSTGIQRLEARFRPNALRIEIGADGTHRSICPLITTLRHQLTESLNP